MSSDLSGENEGECPWESGLSPRARRIGLLVILLAIIAALGAWGVSALWPHRGFVSGTVTLDGRPLLNARVHLRCEVKRRGVGTVIYPDGIQHVSDLPSTYYDYETTTDAQGRYRLSFSRPGQYDVSITRAGEERPEQSFSLPWHPFEFEIAPGFQTCDIPLESKP